MLAGSGVDSGDVWGERTGCALQLEVLGGTRPWLKLRSGPKAEQNPLSLSPGTDATTLAPPWAKPERSLAANCHQGCGATA